MRGMKPSILAVVAALVMGCAQPVPTSPTAGTKPTESKPAVATPAAAAKPNEAAKPAEAKPTAEPAAAPTAAPAAKPTQAAVVTVGMQYDSSNMDPATLTSVTDQQETGSIFEGLARYKLGTTEIEPALAESWTMSPDGLQYTFKLRPNAKFHKDFGPVKASDVKFTIERIRDPNTKSSWAGLYRAITSIETPDDATVRIALANPDVAFPATLAGAGGFIMSEKAVMQFGDKIAQNPIGTGPFSFDHWTPQTELVLARNPDYWGGAPKLDRIVYKPVPDPSTMYAAFEAGNLDIIQVTDPDRYDKYRKDGSFQISEKAGLITRFMGMNSRIKPFDNPKVREAVVRAVNVEDMVEGLFQGMSVRAAGPVAPGVDAHTADLPATPYDPARAKQLLAEAGFPNGFEFTFSVPNIDRFTKPATVIQQSLQAVGIKAEIRIMDAPSLLEAIAKSEAAMYILSRGQEPFADRLLYTWFHTASFPPGQNYAFVEDKDVDGWIDEFRKTTDPNVRKQLGQKVQERVVQGQYYLWIDHEKHIFAANKRVKNFQADPFRSLKLAPVEVTS